VKKTLQEHPDMAEKIALLIRRKHGLEDDGPALKGADAKELGKELAKESARESGKTVKLAAVKSGEG
jgi:hypothetical protein